MFGDAFLRKKRMEKLSRELESRKESRWGREFTRWREVEAAA